MRIHFALLLLLFFSFHAFADGPPSNFSQGSFIRIDANKVISAKIVTYADLTIFYNYPHNGTAAFEEAKNRISVQVNDIQIPQREVKYSKNGVFYVRVTPALLGLGGDALPDGSYWANASVTENSIAYKAYEPKAFVVLQHRTPIPETDFIAVAFFLLLSLLFMRAKGK